MCPSDAHLMPLSDTHQLVVNINAHVLLVVVKDCSDGCGYCAQSVADGESGKCDAGAYCETGTYFDSDTCNSTYQIRVHIWQGKL